MLHPPGVGLGIAFVALLLLAVGVSFAGQLGLQRPIATAAIRGRGAGTGAGDRLPQRRGQPQRADPGAAGRHHHRRRDDCQFAGRSPRLRGSAQGARHLRGALPGAFVGVPLGGGSPVQAGATQLIVLVGLLATQTITVVVAHLLIRSARLLPADLKTSLIA